MKLALSHSQSPIPIPIPNPPNSHPQSPNPGPASDPKKNRPHHTHHTSTPHTSSPTLLHRANPHSPLPILSYPFFPIAPNPIPRKTSHCCRGTSTFPKPKPKKKISNFVNHLFSENVCRRGGAGGWDITPLRSPGTGFLRVWKVR